MSYYTPIDIKFDERALQNYNNVMARYVSELGADLGETIKRSGRVLAENLSLETPPFVDKSASNKLAAKRVGENAAKQDLLKSVTPISSMMDGVFKSKTLKKYIKTREYGKINETMDKMPKFKQWEAVRFDSSLHTNLLKRGTRYGLNKQQKKLTLDDPEWKMYLKKLQSTVGYLKAGWSKSAYQLGSTTVPTWISRHFSYAKGNLVVNLEGDKPFVSFDNYTPTIARYAGRYNYSIVKVTESMMKDIQIRLNYIARKNTK